MALKTILVHLADDADHIARLKTAKTLAKQHGAHLTALFITRPMDLPPQITGRGASIAYAREAQARAEEKAKALEAEFGQHCQASGLSHDWIVEDKEHLEALTEHAHAADLVIVSRGQNQHLEDRVRMRLAEELVMITGLPILVLPTGYTPAPLGKRILIGWKPTREAVRAVRDSLPLLQQADEVMLATVRPTGRDAVSALEIQQYLQRQDVKAETFDFEESDGGAGETLLGVAQAHNRDLIVIGAYGHSRLREVILGGVTRTLFTRSPLPLLMSH